MITTSTSSSSTSSTATHTSSRPAASPSAAHSATDAATNAGADLAPHLALSPYAFIVAIIRASVIAVLSTKEKAENAPPRRTTSYLAVTVAVVFGGIAALLYLNCCSRLE